MGIPKWRPHRGVGTAPFRVALCIVFLTTLLSFQLISGGRAPIQAQTAGDSLYAVLWCGNSDYYVYVNDMEFAFKTLVNDYGYNRDNILVLLKGGGWYNLDGEGGSDVDFAATKANIDTVFARLKRVVTQGDIVFFYATDHGYYENSDCNDAGLRGYNWDNDLISEEDIAGYLGGLDSPTRRVTKILLFNTCDAGGMIPELKDLESPLMISTASKACEAAHYDDRSCTQAPTSCDYSAYSFWWFTAMHWTDPGDTIVSTADANNDGYVTIKEASDYATANDEYAQDDASPKEHPVYYDKNCLSGTITTLGGMLPNLPKIIAFPYPCHGLFPCRWDSWRCAGGGGIMPAAGGETGGAGVTDRVAASLWVDPEPAPGETTYVYARVCNTGDTPITSSVVNFYYSDPTLALVFPEASLNDIATVTVPYLPPHDSLVVGPVAFVPPPSNAFGETHWTLMAVAENYSSPVGTGWLVDDDHIAAKNRFELTGYPNESRIIHVTAQNPLDVPVKALLSIDEGDWPTGWTASLSPEVGDTIELGPNSSVPVQLTLMGIDGAIREGFVDISMSLNTPTVAECGSCDDSTCGGYIGEAGGCSVKLVLQGSVPVFMPEITAAATDREITLSWRCPLSPADLGFNVYRSEKGAEDYVRLNETLIRGSGEMSYVDQSAVPGTKYTYVVGAVNAETENMSLPVEASLEQVPEFDVRQNYPNPFNPATTITYSIVERGRVALKIYDASGQFVCTLVDEDQSPQAGGFTKVWNGRDEKGRLVASGVYFFRLSSGDRTLTKKMVLLR